MASGLLEAYLHCYSERTSANKLKRPDALLARALLQFGDLRESG